MLDDRPVHAARAHAGDVTSRLPTRRGTWHRHAVLRAACLLLAGGVLLACDDDARQQAELRLPAILGDHMVLQCATDAALWGWSAPGAPIDVSASWSDAPSLAHGVTDAQGRWRVSLATPAAGGPHTITVRDGRSERVLHDVLLGETWLASGQSNMEMQLRQVGGAPGEAEGPKLVLEADVPELRLFLVGPGTAATARDDLVGEWTPCTPETAHRFSAVGYLFGRELHEALDVPVGVIASSWGGTPAEAWTPAASLRDLGGFDDVLDDLERMARDPEGAARRHADALVAWRARFDAAGPGPAGGWSDPAFDDASWPTMELPVIWEQTGLDADGIVWFRREVDLPADWRGRALSLSLGPIDDRDVTSVDGVVVGAQLAGEWTTPRVYPVPAELGQDGRLVIAVRVWDTGGAGGICGDASQLTLRLADARDAADAGATHDTRTGDANSDDANPGDEPARSDSVLSLAGSWRYHVGLSPQDVPPQPLSPDVGPSWPNALHAAMIAPLQPFALAGVLWYQGESNIGRAFAYRRLLPALIAGWRAGFERPELPFLIVQIAPFGYGGTTTEAAELKEAQFLTQRDVPHTGLVVTTDVGDPRDIHPRDKTTVARRLLRWALHDVYGQHDVVPSGPLYRAARVDGRTLRIAFHHVEGGLNPVDVPLRCFTIAGEDGVFHPAHAVVDGDEVVVSSDAIAHPVAVRFAWGAADEPELRNGAGLPASPFRTDTFRGVTEP